MLFQKSIQILQNIEGLDGAIIVNFHSKELLAKTPNCRYPIESIVEICAQTIADQQLCMLDLELHDVVENMVTVTATHHHIHYLPSYFDNVVIYAIVRRTAMLPIIFRALEDAGDAMRS